MSQKINIVMDQGATFITSFNIVDQGGNPVDLSTYLGISQMRKSFMSINAYNFNVNAYSNGMITLAMPAANTATIEPGRYLYDVIVVDTSNNISRLIEGLLTVTPCVTDSNTAIPDGIYVYGNTTSNGYYGSGTVYDQQYGNT